MKELQSIVDYETENPAVSAAFNTGCIATCTVSTWRCKAAYFYWSSTSYVASPETAWNVFFYYGGVAATGEGEGNSVKVRAVRGGSVDRPFGPLVNVIL